MGRTQNDARTPYSGQTLACQKNADTRILALLFADELQFLRNFSADVIVASTVLIIPDSIIADSFGSEKGSPLSLPPLLLALGSRQRIYAKISLGGRRRRATGVASIGERYTDSNE